MYLNFPCLLRALAPRTRTLGHETWHEDIGILGSPSENSLTYYVSREVERNPQDLHPVLGEFERLIETNPRIYMLLQSMLQEAQEYRLDIEQNVEIHDCHKLLRVLNHIITHAPPWTDDHPGVPVLVLLKSSMPTVSGYAFFQDPEVNKLIKKTLSAWADFLSSPESACVLNTSTAGWFSTRALWRLTDTANIGGDGFEFEELYICNPDAPHYGFKSWDDFFTRKFREGIRPVAFPDDDSVIVNPCESQPFAVARQVKARDSFWIKGKTYSLSDMLGDTFVARFLDGTVYQGKIVKSYVLDGTYSSTPEALNVNPPNKGPGNEIPYQGYLAAMATRAVILIEAENSEIGLMAFLAIGMAEISTCEISVCEGDYLKKGDELGMFHYGGSSHCLIFQKGVNVTGFPEVGGEKNIPVRGQLAIVTPMEMDGFQVV
ncbi:Phophatidylserine decarboxylase-domain-containing protein [Aspergillus caelatus]|uniref:Phophatidylserine decarboxylase-domain-containing protein n=1 Tax=Aspergillus caelatus TaxID=61420 RepID=A0A5N7AEU6_9EURO|nr:Phophatidylserine decarboxylase-domain-containing protein [Aspergillus caelatus]KAE8368391.1 Phophatidylserine decarboxylase-domain-containing protein [Aspergillus caelatus]